MHNDNYYKQAEKKLDRQMRNDSMRSFLFWAVVVILTPVVLYVGSAFVVGLMR